MSLTKRNSQEKTEKEDESIGEKATTGKERKKKEKRAVFTVLLLSVRKHNPKVIISVVDLVVKL